MIIGMKSAFALAFSTFLLFHFTLFAYHLNPPDSRNLRGRANVALAIPS
jgi:hypothetical protein